MTQTHHPTLPRSIEYTKSSIFKAAKIIYRSVKLIVETDAILLMIKSMSRSTASMAARCNEIPYLVCNFSRISQGSSEISFLKMSIFII